MNPAHDHRRRAFTLVELVVVLGIVGFLAMFMVHPGGERRRSKAWAAVCMSNLRQLGSALIMYSQDNHQKSPTESLEATTGQAFEYFNQLSPYIASNRRVLTCPADTRKHTTNNILMDNSSLSYFVTMRRGFETNEPSGVIGRPLLLAGDRNLTGGNWAEQVMTVTSQTRLEWTNGLHSTKESGPSGNILFTDGHVEWLTTAQLRKQLAHSGSITQRFVMPITR